MTTEGTDRGADRAWAPTRPAHLAAPPPPPPPAAPLPPTRSAGAPRTVVPARTAPVPAPGRSGRGGKVGRPPAPRRARLVVRRLDPWSVLKFSLVYSLCLLLVGLIAVTSLYYALDGIGVFDSLARAIDTLTDAPAGNSSRQSFRPTLIIGAAAVLLGINSLLLTALATLGAFLYNLCASFAGGIEVTLAERD